MQDLLKMKIEPPFVPKVKGNLDTSNFEHYEDDRRDEPYLDDACTWDREF